MNSTKRMSNYRTKMASLKINGKHYSLCEGINTIGRCITATVPLKHMDISKQHAIVTIVNENQHYVTDFQSFNGTVMNDSKLQPLVLYDLSEGCSIQFGNVNAVYHKIPTVSQAQHHGHDYSTSSVESTQNSQFMTQSFYDGATQALDNDRSISHGSPEIEHPQNYFDDDYNFADVSTQLSPPNLPTNPQKPLSIHDMPTQLFCEDVQESVVVTSDNNIDQQPIVGKGTTELCEDIHEMETQIDDNFSIHNMPTQLIGSHKDIHHAMTQPLDGSSINNMPTQLTVNAKNVDVDKDIHQTVTQPLDTASIHNLPTQVTSDTNKNNMPTQLTVNPKNGDVNKDIHQTVTQPLDTVSIHNLPTQLTSDNNKNNMPTQLIVNAKNGDVDKDIHQTVTEPLDTASIDNLPTQLTSDTNNQDSKDIHGTVTQPIDNSSIYNIPTQLTKNTNNDDTLNSTSVIDGTINLSNIHEEQSTDSQSDELQVNRLCRRKIKPIGDDSETSDKESESDEVVKCKVRKKVKIIESESETDAEEEVLKVKPDLAASKSETKMDSGSETDIEDLVTETKTDVEGSCVVSNEGIKLSAVEKDVASIDSDTDVDDFEFNTQADTSNLNENEDDYIIPGTQCEDDNRVNKTSEEKEDVHKMANSVEMDSLYLEPTQPILNDDVFLEPPALVTTVMTNDPHNISTNDDEIFIRPIQPVRCVEYDAVFEQATQPMTIEQQTKPKKNLNSEEVTDSQSDAIFMQPTQPIVDISMDDSSLVDDVFLQPTQPIPIPPKDTLAPKSITFEQQTKPKKNLNSGQLTDLQSDAIFMQPTQPIVDISMDDSSLVDDVFLQPTQPIPIPPKDMLALKSIGIKNISDMEKQKVDSPPPTQVIQINTQEDIFEQPTQIVSDEKPRADNIEEQLEDMFASQQSPKKLPQIESQLEVIFDSQNVGIDINNSRPSNPLVSELEGKLKDNETIATTTNSTVDMRKSYRRKTRQSSTEKVVTSDKVKNSVELLDRISMNLHENKEKSGSDNSNGSLSVDSKSVAPIEDQTHRRNNETTVDEHISMSTSKPNRQRAVSKKKEAEIVKSKEKDKQKLGITEKAEPKMRATRRTDKKLERGLLSTSNVDTATAASVNITKRKPLHKEPQFDEAKNKKKCTELDSETNIELPSKAPLPVITKDVPKRLTRARNTSNEQSPVKEESKPNVPSRVHQKLVLKKNESKGLEKFESLINPSHFQVTEIQSNIPTDGKNTKEIKSTTTSKRKSANKRGPETSSDVEQTKRPRRNITVPKKFLENEGSASSTAVNTRRGNRARNQVSPETSDSESIGSVTSTSKNSKRKRLKADISTSTSESEQQVSASTHKGGREKRVLTVGNTSNVSNKKQQPAHSDGDEFIPATPSRGKRLDSTISESTPERNKRALKPKVVFTMLDNPDLESVIRRLGGRVVDSVEVCTVLVTGNLKRSQKLLTAVGQSKPICSPDWILECKKANKFLDPWDYILQDKEAETKWKLSLKESLIRSRDSRLLEGYVVYLTVTGAIDVLKGAVESCGGKCVLKAPPKSTGNLIVVANAENKAKYSKFLKQSPPVNVVLPEAIFDGVLRQELRLQDHLLR